MTLRLVGEALMAAGFVLMTLGILEIGGLFNVGVGFAAIWLGCALVLLRDEAAHPDVDEELHRMADER